jgi:hypothetical protein
MQVAHDVSEFQDGEERILVLKDTSILENEGNLMLIQMFTFVLNI